MTKNNKLNNQEELFARDCKLMNLKYEYDGYTGTEKWAVITELTEEELWDKYPDIISRYTPFVLLSMAQGKVIIDDNRETHRCEMRDATDNVLRELKKSHCFKTEKRRALTKPEQELFLEYLKNTPEAQYWYPIFAVMVGTGLRVGELTGLRWCDIDLEEGIIDVNHTLVYYDHRTEGSKKGCYFNVNTTKTPAGMRQVPMLEFVKEAFLMEKERQELLGLHCEATVDGYTDFVFVNRFGQPQHQATLNKAIRRIIRNCNDKQFLESENPEVLLPHFSCHSLRHTFTTRMCEAGVNVKVIQDALGHKDVSTTLNIYTDVTKELRKSEFEGLELQFNQ